MATVNKYMTVGVLRNMLADLPDDAFVGTTCENRGDSHLIRKERLTNGVEHGSIRYRYGEPRESVTFVELWVDEGSDFTTRYDEEDEDDD